MLSDEIGPGSISSSVTERKLFAKQALDYNFQNIDKFNLMFSPFYYRMSINGDEFRVMTAAEKASMPKECDFSFNSSFNSGIGTGPN